MSDVDDALRRRWLERLDREAFGCPRPPLTAYADFRRRWHARIAWVFVVGVLVLTLAAFRWGKFAPSLLLLIAFLVTYAKGRRSALWGWFLFGHSMADRVDRVIPTATWTALQADAASGESEALRELALRRWATYRLALAALGNSFPDDPVFRRGAGFRR